MTALDTSGWDDVSRELTLVCDAQDRISALDSRAARILGAAIGTPLLSLAVPGTEGKTETLLSRGRREPLGNWEVSLVARGTPVSFLFAARPAGDGSVRLLGLALPGAFGDAIAQLNDSLAEVVNLNRQISGQKKELTAKHDELTRAYRELDESNKGVLALHAELADKADTLRRTSEVKTRVVANVSHELRTPLTSILGLTRILLTGTDGPLTAEQEKQVNFIRSSAEELSQLINDVLDLAKTEAGKLQLRPQEFTLEQFFAALRGTVRPLMSGAPHVSLWITAPAEDIALNTDQGKVAQILRNLISNALKFTEEGEITVSAEAIGDRVQFRVRDTGIGIAAEHLDRIFEEFGQVDGAIQRRVQGTGLGLPLSRRLAELLGGTLTVVSAPGNGSTFTLDIPLVHLEVSEIEALQHRPRDPMKAPVLVVEDDRKTIFIYEKYLALAGFQVIPARTIAEAEALVTMRPSAIVLDIMLENETTWDFLARLKGSPDTRDIPVLVVTVSSKAQKARALGADEFWLKPIDQDRLIRKLQSLTRPAGASARLLIIDDDERARYVIRKLLDGTPYVIHEAAGGPEGIRVAREERPDVILLDFLLEDITAFDVLDELKADPRTRSIPVVVITSHLLDASERSRLSAGTEVILSKENLSREVAINRITDALRKSTAARTASTIEEL